MVYINLLPIKEIKQRSKAVQQLTLFAVCLIAVLAAIGAVGFYQASIASQLQKEITTLQAEKQRFQKVLDQIKKLEQDKKIIENKIAVIKRLQKTAALTVHVLDEVANLTPTRRLWIKSLKHRGTNLQLSGMALDNQTIAQYMETLKTSEYISSVSLSNTTLSKFAERDLKSFQLTAVINIPETAETETSTQTE